MKGEAGTLGSWHGMKKRELDQESGSSNGSITGRLSVKT